MDLPIVQWVTVVIIGGMLLPFIAFYLCVFAGYFGFLPPHVASDNNANFYY